MNAKWLVLAATALGAFLGAIMFTSVNVALPSMKEALDTEFNVLQWVVLSYLLATGAVMPILGRLADMIGKKALFIAGYVIFTLASLLCGIAPGVGSLIFFRALQGLGGAFLTALSLAIITDTFPKEERGRAIGINGSILSIGIVLGPSLGGLLADAFSWRWIFLLAFIPGLLGVILAQRFIPQYQRLKNQRFDIPGAIILFISLLALLLALTLGQNLGFGSAAIVALFASSAVLLLAFVLLELRTADPMINLHLFKNSQLSIGLLTGFVTFIAISGTILLMPFYLGSVLGYSQRDIGLLMSVVPILLVFASPLAGIVADRIGERPVTLVGMLSLLLGYSLLGTLSEETTALGYILRFLPVGFGMAVFQTPNNTAIMGSVPPHSSGVAGGLLAFTRTLGTTAGVAILGTVWAVRVMQAGNVSDATLAPAAAQIAGLQDMFFFLQFAIILALALIIWDIIMRARRKQLATAQPSD